MRTITIGTVCFVALAVVACKRAPAPGQTTTTSGETPYVEPNLATPLATVNEEPANAPSTLDEVDVIGSPVGSKATVRPSDRSAAPNKSAATDERAASPPALGAADEDRPLPSGDGTLDPKTKGSSFESSGGTSGLGVYGQPVPGQKLFEVKPNAADGGR